MRHCKHNRRVSNRRRGVTAIFVTVLIPVLLGFAALTIDVGTMYNTRADLQRTADAAALAGASAYVEDDMMRVRQQPSASGLMSYVLSSANGRVNEFAGYNLSFGTSSMHVESGDFAAGWIDVTSGTSPIQTGALPSTFNAVQVTVQRNSEVANGPVEYFFSAVFGAPPGSTSATAVAVFDDRVAGFDTSKGDGGLLPFTVSKNIYESELQNGSDDYGYDSSLEAVTSGSDGIKEIKLFDYNFAPGNFGLLNIGTPNQSNAALAAHIEDGVPPEDFVSEIGTEVLTFYDDSASPVTYDITGNPGLHSALESSLETRLGQVIGFMLHDQTTGEGEHTEYRVTEMRFGRVVLVELNGNPGDRGFWVQPVSYGGAGVILGPNAPSSGGMVGRLVLAR